MQRNVTRLASEHQRLEADNAGLRKVRHPAPYTLVTPDDKWFRGRLVFKARRLLYHSTLGSRVMTKKKTTKRFLTVAACHTIHLHSTPPAAEERHRGLAKGAHPPTTLLELERGSVGEL